MVRTPRSERWKQGFNSLMEKIFFNDKEIENIKINNELEDKEKKLNPNKI